MSDVSSLCLGNLNILLIVHTLTYHTLVYAGKSPKQLGDVQAQKD